jgi:hypothetical protein
MPTTKSVKVILFFLLFSGWGYDAAHNSYSIGIINTVAAIYAWGKLNQLRKYAAAK